MITIFYSYLTNFVTYHYVELKEGIHDQISHCFSYWVSLLFISMSYGHWKMKLKENIKKYIHMMAYSCGQSKSVVIS